MAQCLHWLNQQLLPKASLNLTNLIAGIGQQLLVPKPPHHGKEQDVSGTDINNNIAYLHPPY